MNMKIENRKPLDTILSKSSSWRNDESLSDIQCPECGFECQHCEMPKVIEGHDNYESGWGGRGDLIVIPVCGECGSEWEICFGFHKGVTSTFIRIIKSCSELKSYVYFIEALGMDKVKIGFSNDPERRLSVLQTGSPSKLIMVAKIPGDIQLEKQLHNKFDHIRINKEWFHATKELKEFIKEQKLS